MANEVSVEITIEEKAALKALTRLSKGIDGTTNNAVQKVKKMDMAFASFAGNLAANAVGAMKDFAIQGVRAAATEIVDFDKRIREINTLLPKNTKLTQKTTDALRDLSGQFGTSQATQAKSFYQIISSGAATGARAVELLAQANTLAVGGIADVGSSINVLTDIINIYGEENITAKQAADSLFTTVRLGKTTISELASNMGAVLPSAQRLGVSLDDVGAALATMTTQGLTTGQRTTQLQALFTALFRKSGDASKLFGKKIGDAFSLAALRTKGLSKFLEDLQEATGGNEEILTKLLGRMEGVQAVFALTGKNTKTLDSNLESMTRKAGAAGLAFKEIEESLDVQAAKAYQNTLNLIAGELTMVAEGFREAFIWYNKLFGGPETIEEVDGAIGTLNKKVDLLKLKLENAQTQGSKDWFARRLEQESRTLDDLIQKRVKLTSGGEVFGPTAPTAPGEPSKPSGGTPDTPDPAADARVLRERAVMAELNMIRAEQEIAEEERKLLVKEAAGMATEEDLIALQELEAQKISIKAQAELEKTELIKGAKERELAEQKVAVQTSLNLEKLETKQTIDELKRRQLLEQQIGQAKLQTAQNFMSAGLALAKEGSSTQKALLSAQALMSTYSAAAQAIAAPPGPPWSFALAASTVAMGLANVAKINGVGFANGGVVGGFVGATPGPDNTSSNGIGLRTGEMVLTSTDQKTLFDNIRGGDVGGGNMDEVKGAIMELASQPIIVQIDNKEVARAVRDASRDGFQVAS